jgi:hypothetical protein
MQPSDIDTVGLVKISVLLTPDDAARFEAYCKQRGHKKSTLIAHLIREHLGREEITTQEPVVGNWPKEREKNDTTPLKQVPR